MCSSADTQAMVFFHRNASFYDLDYGGTSFSNISRGCHIYRWDLVTDSNRAIGVLDWDDGGFTGLRLRPVTAAGIEVKIDYATLSRRRKGEAITIRWDAADDPVTLLLSDEANGSRRTRIAGNRTGGEFTWRTPNLPPGTYHIVAAASGIEGTPDGAGRSYGAGWDVGTADGGGSGSGANRSPSPGARPADKRRVRPSGASTEATVPGCNAHYKGSVVTPPGGNGRQRRPARSGRRDLRRPRNVAPP